MRFEREGCADCSVPNPQLGSRCARQLRREAGGVDCIGARRDKQRPIAQALVPAILPLRQAACQLSPTRTNACTIGIVLRVAQEPAARQLRPNDQAVGGEGKTGNHRPSTVPPQPLPPPRPASPFVLLTYPTFLPSRTLSFSCRSFPLLSKRTLPCYPCRPLALSSSGLALSLPSILGLLSCFRPRPFHLLTPSPLAPYPSALFLRFPPSLPTSSPSLLPSLFLQLSTSLSPKPPRPYLAPQPTSGPSPPLGSKAGVDVSAAHELRDGTWVLGVNMGVRVVADVVVGVSAVLVTCVCDGTSARFLCDCVLVLMWAYLRSRGVRARGFGMQLLVLHLVCIVFSQFTTHPL